MIVYYGPVYLSITVFCVASTKTFIAWHSTARNIMANKTYKLKIYMQVSQETYVSAGLFRTSTVGPNLRWIQ